MNPAFNHFDGLAIKQPIRTRLLRFTMIGKQLSRMPFTSFYRNYLKIIWLRSYKLSRQVCQVWPPGFSEYWYFNPYSSNSFIMF